MTTPLTTLAQIKCLHGGLVAIIPKPNVVAIEGQSPLLMGDLMGAQIACPLVPSPGSKPCTSVVVEPIQWMAPPFLQMTGRAPFTFMPGVPGGVTDSVPPGMLMCYSAGQTCV